MCLCGFSTFAPSSSQSPKTVCSFESGYRQLFVSLCGLAGPLVKGETPAFTRGQLGPGRAPRDIQCWIKRHSWKVGRMHPVVPFAIVAAGTSHVPAYYVEIRKVRLNVNQLVRLKRSLACNCRVFSSPQPYEQTDTNVTMETKQQFPELSRLKGKTWIWNRTIYSRHLWCSVEGKLTRMLTMWQRI